MPNFVPDYRSLIHREQIHGHSSGGAARHKYRLLYLDREQGSGSLVQVIVAVSGCETATGPEEENGPSLLGVGIARLEHCVVLGCEIHNALLPGLGR